MAEPSIRGINPFELGLRCDERVLGDLVRGYSISYGDPEYPGEFIREHPNGHRESTRRADDGTVTKVRDIPPVDYMNPARLAERLAKNPWTSYRDPEYPAALVREYPDGRRIILHVADGDGTITEGRKIPPR